MKSMFGRLFALTAALILISTALIGMTVRIEMGQYLLGETKDTLRKYAETVSRLAAAFYLYEGENEEWTFRVGLSFTADIAGSESIVCDEAGRVMICSEKDPDCTGKVLSADIIERVERSGEYFERGTLDGLFETTRMAICVPLRPENDGPSVGTVIVYTELREVNTLLSHTTELFLITGLIVFAIAITATSVVANRQTRPLKALAKTAREFGHGNLRARAVIDESNTEEMNELAAAFNNMATSLEKSETQRREFVANVSHELKTPMTTIAGFMDGMIDGTIPQEEHTRYMQTVSDEVRRLSRLVRSMLEVSRIQDQGIPEEQKRKFDVCELIGRVLLTFEQKINSRGLNVEVQMPDNGIRVFAEQDSITQVIYNLIDNAVKFCDDGGSLYLQAESDGTKATVSVANTGKTIPPEELPLVFDRFHKTDKSRSENRDGAGLGLYIAKTIVVTHGEDISVTSRDGVTRFSFTLPVR